MENKGEKMGTINLYEQLYRKTSGLNNIYQIILQ